ncbi:hypothetical protein [Roseateles sp. MS654]|uniref:hypothetical protein n=1 Tax=Roseateles sp. MS654 TaxID=3412685 RepID=UPI003C30774E
MVSPLPRVGARFADGLWHRTSGIDKRPRLGADIMKNLVALALVASDTASTVGQQDIGATKVSVPRPAVEALGTDLTLDLANPA